MRIVDRRIRTVARAISDEVLWGIHPIDKDAPPYRRNGAAIRASRRYANIRAAVRALAALDGDIIATFTATIDESGWDWDDTQWEAIFQRDRDPDGTLWATRIGVVVPAARPGFDPTEPEPDLDRVHVTVRHTP